MSAFVAPRRFACSPTFSEAPAPVIIVGGSVNVDDNFLTFLIRFLGRLKGHH